MKKLLLFFVTLLLITSCSTEEKDTIPFHMEFVGIESYILPEGGVMRGYEYDVTITYKKPSDCYYFQGFYYLPNGSEHIIAPQMMVVENADCQPLDIDSPEEATFRFTCSNTYEFDHYTFKFYEGEDEMGNQIFREVEVPVLN